MDSPKIYGYLRVSTEKQSLDNNKAEILLKANSLGINTCVIWIEEKISGTKHWRQRELGKLIDTIIKPKDIIITSEISRIGRSTLQILEFASVCIEKDISVYVTKGDFKFSNSRESQILIFAYSLVSGIERDLISQRTKSALATKKANGIILGRPKGKFKLDPYKNEIIKLLESGVKIGFIAKKFNTSYSSLIKFIKLNKLNNKDT